MKILLDENLDRRLRDSLGLHQVFTVRYLGWNGLRNGALLQTAEDDGFEILITGDQTLRYEQNLIGRRLAVVQLSTVEWRILKDYLSQIMEAVGNAVPGSFQAVDCGSFNRKKTEAE